MRLSKRRRTLPSWNMTPMIDVVFQLLIFFMTCMQASEVSREPVELPELTGAEEQKEGTVTINVMADESIVVGGESVGLDGAIREVAEALDRVGGSPQHLTVVLRGDRRSASRPINALVRALRQMEIQRIRLAVQIPEGGP